MTASRTEAITAPVDEKGSRDDIWRPSTRGWAARFVVQFVIFGGIILITSLVPGHWAFRIALAAIWAIIGLSLNVILGYIGQVSLGHHGFIGIGAFVAAYYATEQAGCRIGEGAECSTSAFLSATALAVLSGGIAAGLLGLVALRIKGLYLALITLAYGFMAERTIFEISGLTRGGAGMPAPRPAGFTSDTAFAYLCFVALAIVLFLDWRLLKSKTGRAVLAIKHSEPVAASYGVNVTAYKILAFILSGMFAGLAGALLAFWATNVVSNDFQFQTALLWVLMVVVGGLGSRTGVVIGSAFFALFPSLIELVDPLEHFLLDLLNREEGEMGEITLVLGALLAVLTMIQFKGGIAEQLSPILRWLSGQRFSMHPEGHGSHKSHKPSPAARLRKSKGEDPSEGNGRTGDDAEPASVTAPVTTAAGDGSALDGHEPDKTPSNPTSTSGRDQ